MKRFRSNTSSFLLFLYVAVGMLVVIRPIRASSSSRGFGSTYTKYIRRNKFVKTKLQSACFVPLSTHQSTSVPKFGINQNNKCTFLLPKQVASPSNTNKRFTRTMVSSSVVSDNREETTTVKNALSNHELAQRRLEYYQSLNDEKYQIAKYVTQRNYELKERLQNSPTASLVAVKVVVDTILRTELKLSGREKRGRVFLDPQTSNATQTLRGLKRELHGFFRALKKDSYLLQGSLLLSSTNETLQSTSEKWDISTDEDVIQTFERVQNHYNTQQQTNEDGTAGQHEKLKRPSLVLHVIKNPNAPKDDDEPYLPYLENMPNPADSPTITMLSYYSFGNIKNPDEFAVKLRKLYEPFHALGRIYVATEGINAQMSVPTNVLKQFIECCEYYLPDPDISYYLRTLGNSVNVDPIPLTREEYATAGTPAAGGKPCPPFTALHIRVRQQIVTDGLDKTYDWTDAGYDMPPLEWHEKLQEARKLQEQAEKDKDKVVPIILDCRNTYETDIGIFEGAVPLQTTTFKDTWEALEEQLSDKPKDTPIFMYCTGGIRCVKVGAYVTQELGYKNVARLAGGIIAYDRALSNLQTTTNQTQEGKAIDVENKINGDTENKTTTSLFKGTNFVFDGRLGRKITDDAFGTCITCGAKTTFVCNCRNENCHRRMVQCNKCRTNYLGTCSSACHNRVQYMFERKKEQYQQQSSQTEVDSTLTGDIQTPQQYTTLDAYSLGHSSPIPEVYAEMEFNTKALIPSGSHMVSGQAQGRLLKQLASMTREGRILELGTFTGYATACLWEGAIEAGKFTGSQSGSRSGGAFVMSMERDARAYDVAASHLQIISQHGFRGDDAMEAMCRLRANNKDITKKGRIQGSPIANLDDNQSVTFATQDEVASCELVKVTDGLAILEEMALKGQDQKEDANYVAPFDMVFIDADKTRLIEYVNACLVTDNVLKKGGLIVVDNVLWKGLVLEASGAQSGSNVSKYQQENDNLSDSDDDSSGSDSETDELTGTTSSIPSEVRKNRRARKLANKMHRFNSAIVQDNRVEVLVLPIRDGLSIIRKK